MYVYFAGKLVYLIVRASNQLAVSDEYLQFKPYPIPKHLYVQ